MEQEFLNYGLTAFAEENYRTAIENFTKSIEKNSENYNGFLFRACSHIALGEYELALSDLTQAEEINQTLNYDILYNRSRAYLLNMDFKDAQTCASLGLELPDLTEEQKGKLNNLVNRIVYQ